MQNDIHPDYPFVTVTLADGTEFTTRSTMGKDYKSEVDSSNHPFYTGKKTMVDTAGRVEKFMRRYGNSQAKQAVAAQEQDAAEPLAIVPRLPVPDGPLKRNTRLFLRAPEPLETDERRFENPPFVDQYAPIPAVIGVIERVGIVRAPITPVDSNSVPF